MSTTSDSQLDREDFVSGSAFWRYESKWLDLLPVGVYFCDAEGVLLGWNRCAVELWGREPVVGDRQQLFCGSLTLYDADSTFLDHSKCPMAEALRTSQPQRIPEVGIERPDGSRRIVSVTIDPIWDDSGTLVGAVNVFQDITERKHAERARSQSENRFFRLLEKLPAAAYTCDANGLITYFNTRAAELWGRSPKIKDSVDRFCGSFRLFATDGTPIEHQECWMSLALRNRRDYEGEEILIEREDGTRRTALAYATPFYGESKQLAGAVNVLIDITDQKDAKDRIGELLTREKEQSERLREADRRKDEFLAMLAHELRNPLAPIRSGLDILAMSSGDDPDTIELMQEQLEHLVRLVDDLLDVSRIMRGRIELRKETVELSTLIERSVDAVQSMIQQNSQQLTITLPPDPVWLHADPVRLVQVIANLLTNASKYTDPHGHITLTAECVEGKASICVQDTGVGIEEDLLPRVFDLFTQSSRSLDRANGGLGIGLTLAKNLIEMHGGSLSAQSEGVGRGSTFVVTLGVVDAPLAITTQDEQIQEFESRRILVVDDNRGAAFLLSKLLSKLADHEIDTAFDGPTALRKVTAMRPDLVLLDIGLPEMDGFEVGRAIRQIPELDDVLLVALTGYGQEDDRRKSQEAGFDEHLVKPPSLDQMKAVLSHPKLSKTR